MKVDKSFIKAEHCSPTLDTLSNKLRSIYRSDKKIIISQRKFLEYQQTNSTFSSYKNISSE